MFIKVGRYILFTMEKTFGPLCAKCNEPADYYKANKKGGILEYRCKVHRVFIKGYRIYSRKSGFYYTYLGQGATGGKEGPHLEHWFEDVTGQQFSMSQKEIEQHGMMVAES